MINRKVKVEVEVVTNIPAMGDEPYFVANVYRLGKKVYEAVSAHKGNVKDKALRGYESEIKSCEFEVSMRPERFNDASKPRQLTREEVIQQAKELIAEKGRLFPNLSSHLLDIQAVLDQ